MPKTKRRRPATRRITPAATRPEPLPRKTGGSTGGDEPVLPQWRWRTFPVLCAFVSGMLIAFLSNGATSNPFAFVLLIAALLGFGYCLAHLVVTNMVVGGRARRRSAIARGEQAAEDFEDELVYDDEG